MAHTTLMMVVSAGRVPVAIATPGRLGETRLAMEALGAGCGASVVLVGPSEVLVELLDVEPGLLDARPGQVLLVDKGYRDAETEAILAAQGVTLLRPAYKGEAPRPGQRLFRPLRQLIESVNDTLKGQLDLECHGGRTIQGVTVRLLQRLLALTAAIWHNHRPASRSCAP